MKKIYLRRQEDFLHRKRIGYKINYEAELNPSQLEAVIHNSGPALVIAGAGTGKTRTLIYRVSRLVEDGIQPESILLLTFTRKASAEMLRRASLMLDGRCERVSGGTFHSFAMLVLRQYSKLLGYDNNFTILDQTDSEDTVNLLRSRFNYDKSRKRFPRKDTLCRIFNLSVNRCSPVEEIIMKDFPFFIEETQEIIALFNDFNSYKRKYNLMDYDDLLINLNLLCKNHPDVRSVLNERYKYLMVDEYQDTNRLQHEIALQLSGKESNIMAVGDDAQSIYSFRGAEFQNIMTFPYSFGDCKIYKIEENYRSTQQILNLTNKIIENAAFKYEKELFTRKESGLLPKIISAENERQQSLFVVQEVLGLREQQFSLEDIAVMFRSSFLSFDLEIELNKANIPYKKFGGMKFIETAHIKDILCFFKVIENPDDAVSWNRILLLLDGIGSKTASKIIETFSQSSFKPGNKPFDLHLPKNFPQLNDLFDLFSRLFYSKSSIGEKTLRISEFYKPLFQKKYDDWQKRSKDIESFISIAERYSSVQQLLNDMAIEPPIETVAELEPESKDNEFINLTTIHSAKGLEWKAVILIWALEGRFPSAKSVESIDTLEEERRLFYVACTRAKDLLYITYPTNIFDRVEGVVLSKPSRFLDDIGEELADRFILQDFEPEEN